MLRSAPSAGPLSSSIPSGGRSVQRAHCPIGRSATVFSVGPHMHQLGVHMRIVAQTRAHGELILHDADYDFQHQLNYDVPDVELGAGDQIALECTYQHMTGRAVGWGDSSLDEMCFASVATYPSLRQGGGVLPCGQ